MYDILDISRYVLYYAKKCGHGLSVLQLMKILYFVQAQFLISRKKRAFSDEIVAMDLGACGEKSLVALQILRKWLYSSASWNQFCKRRKRIYKSSGKNIH